MEPHYTEIREIVEDKPMESYYVTFRSRGNDYRRQERFSADDFGHAEQQAIDSGIMSNDEEIIQIERDYKV